MRVCLVTLRPSRLAGRAACALAANTRPLATVAARSRMQARWPLGTASGAANMTGPDAFTSVHLAARRRAVSLSDSVSRGVARRGARGGQREEDASCRTP